MAYVLAATWTAKEGEEEAVRAALESLVGPTRAEPGCLYYQLHRDPGDARVFFIYEQYTDQDAFEAHMASDHVRRHLVEDAIPRLEQRERAFYETIDV
jgi:quinol monooxygenase YgiN